GQAGGRRIGRHSGRECRRKRHRRRRYERPVGMGRAFVARVDRVALPAGPLERGLPMADAIIDLAGPEDLPVIVKLYNQMFRPGRDLDSFRRRFQGRYNVLQLIARVDDRPVGFFLGFELKPTVYFAWFYGVLPEMRRQGIASQLMDAVHSWARQN